MPGHDTATYSHPKQFLAKVQGKRSKSVRQMSDKNTVKNSKKRQLSWPGVGETCATFSFPSCLHIRAGVLRRAATWRAKIRENTEVDGGRSFGQPEY